MSTVHARATLESASEWERSAFGLHHCLWPFSVAMDYALAIMIEDAAVGDLLDGPCPTGDAVTRQRPAVVLLGLAVYAAARSADTTDLHEVRLLAVRDRLRDDATARADAELTPVGTDMFESALRPMHPRGTLGTEDRARLVNPLTTPSEWEQVRGDALDAVDRSKYGPHLLSLLAPLRQRRIRQSWWDNTELPILVPAGEAGTW